MSLVDDGLALPWSASHSDVLVEALERIASCEKRADGDLVDIARTALDQYQAGGGS